MLKEKWKKLLLREKILLISAILFILSIPLSLITLRFIVVFMTLFVVSVFYNMYKFMNMAGISISEAIEIDTQKGQKELQKGEKISGTLRSVALPLAFGMGIPMVVIILIFLWIAI